ncbi:PLP-dependent aminotransferase family protein [Pikeienuella piscinae]|uniref:PLP-dependent aminotransferase family protein n=1 Tax=Pikeienuella piscinae TaxID=2748098 RepID=A0A7L5BSM2_9RHOB|nr:PLP-dependent aminotransferase family protein [Pikeienuella piscinae]QIE54145.1 PLP-dependent aminotransferase family protein [Pikeienuella piscinae]
MSFDFNAFVREDLPPAAARWTGFPAYNFVGGHNDEASVPVEALRAAADAVLMREGSNLGTYFLQSGPLGYRPLREFLCAKLKRAAAMDVDPDEILLTSGSLQAIDLINAAMLAPGDTVIVEESNYGGVFPRLARAGVEIVTIPVDAGGMDIDALETALKQLDGQGTKAKYIYTIPTVHNPTGTIMPEERRIRFVALAARHGVPIFEDECYSDLIWSGERPPALHALDREGLVIHVGSFSKSIAPALRVGYIVAPWAVLSHILSVKHDAGSGALEQMVLAEFCATHFDDHVAGLNRALEAKLDALIDALDEHFGASVEFERPPGGIFLWVKLPEGVETTRLAEVALAGGVAVNPGREWSKGADAGRWIRLCFANPAPEAIRDGVARLADICHAEFGTPEIGANRRRAPS